MFYYFFSYLITKIWSRSLARLRQNSLAARETLKVRDFSHTSWDKKYWFIQFLGQNLDLRSLKKIHICLIVSMTKWMTAMIEHPVNWVKSPNDPPKLVILSISVYLTSKTVRSASDVGKTMFTMIIPSNFFCKSSSLSLFGEYLSCKVWFLSCR